jgi:two-component system phosphate regulon response regulator PhoB
LSGASHDNGIAPDGPVAAPYNGYIGHINERIGGMMGTILLVEDDPDIRHMVAYKLTKGGFDVIEAADGFAALREAQNVPLDLVILDIRMPRMPGLDVCRELRGRPPTATVPIIVVTARARPEDIEQAYAAGATDYVVKPFSPRELLERVQSALQRVGR